jgi:hypothetical protein
MTPILAITLGMIVVSSSCHRENDPDSHSSDQIVIENPILNSEERSDHEGSDVGQDDSPAQNAPVESSLKFEFNLPESLDVSNGVPSQKSNFSLVGFNVVGNGNIIVTCDPLSDPATLFLDVELIQDSDSSVIDSTRFPFSCVNSTATVQINDLTAEVQYRLKADIFSDNGGVFTHVYSGMSSLFTPIVQDQTISVVLDPVEPLALGEILAVITLGGAQGSPGLARIYDRSPLDSLIDQPLLLTGDGTLTSEHFESDGSNVARAFAGDLQFIYEVGDARFPEVSTFTNATRVLAWFASFGFDMAEEKITIQANATIGGSVNNAVYMPSVGAGATIAIGSGDGAVLQNLALDRDVVFHEFSHHVIFQKLQATSGESLVLHEGLADSLTMLHNDDPCLGPSICPALSSVCAVQGQCLRTADNNLTMSTAPGTAHLDSQVLSGYIWDLHQSGTFSGTELVTLTLAAIDQLSSQSSFVEFVNAMLSEDQSLFGGAHGGIIGSLAADRELI